MSEQKTVAIVGSTGSIGTQSIQVIADDPENYRVSALAAGRSVDQLVSQALAIEPDLVAIGDETLLGQVRDALPSSIEVVGGIDGLAECARRADTTINGVVGFAGLPVTLACLEAGKRLALAQQGIPHCRWACCSEGARRHRERSWFPLTRSMPLSINAYGPMMLASESPRSRSRPPAGHSAA